MGIIVFCFLGVLKQVVVYGLTCCLRRYDQAIILYRDPLDVFRPDFIVDSRSREQQVATKQVGLRSVLDLYSSYIHIHIYIYIDTYIYIHTRLFGHITLEGLTTTTAQRPEQLTHSGPTALSAAVNFTSGTEKQALTLYSRSCTPDMGPPGRSTTTAFQRSMRCTCMCLSASEVTRGPRH